MQDYMNNNSYENDENIQISDENQNVSEILTDENNSVNYKKIYNTHFLIET